MELEIILMFRELGFLISDIKAYLDNCNANKFLEIAENKLDYINNEINKLNKLRNILEHKKENLKLASKAINNNIEIVEYKGECILEVPFTFKEYNIEEILNKSKKYVK